MKKIKKYIQTNVNTLKMNDVVVVVVVVENHGIFSIKSFWISRIGEIIEMIDK